MGKSRSLQIRRNLPSGEREAILKKWRRSMRRIEREVGDLLLRRETFVELRDIVNDNPRIMRPPSFVNWIVGNYVCTVALGIRRLTDTDRRAESLGRLLHELIECPGVLSRVAHRRLYGRRSSVADEIFNSLVGTGKSVLPARAIRADRRLLNIGERRIRRLVNKRLAHANKPSGIRRPPTLGEVSEVLDVMDRLAVKYSVLLAGSTMASCKPTRQFNWRTVLRFAWLPQ
jgi:hypothetical protein